MKIFTYILILFLGLISSTGFSRDGVYEVPFDQKDRQIDIGLISEVMFFAKEIKCDKEDYAIIYQSLSGYSHSSTLHSVCKRELSFSLATCAADRDPKSAQCYRAVMKKYDIDAKRKQGRQQSGKSRTE